MAFLLNKPALRGGFFLICSLPVATLVVFVWLIFSTALPGIVQFDDVGNLSGLSSISSFNSAWYWIQSGNAGPLGRPLSLVTFALQYYEWPSPAAFLQWNIALHLINALLIFWVAVLLARRLNYSYQRQIIIGFVTAFAWAVLPLLNTSVLFIVQRMTLLAATFTLAGLIAYLKLRGPATAPWQQQMGALLALAIFGLLGLLAKESGALIVVYALVLEGLVITYGRERKFTLAIVALLLGNILLLGGLLSYLPWPECAMLTRGYNLWDRLGSQGFLLLMYLKGLFLPTSADLNPFRFEFLLRDSNDMRWGIGVWLLLMASPLAAWRLGGRRALPIVLALVWFFYGHIMESGWLSLEPYFAHRNYLPALGLVFFLTAWILIPRPGALLWNSIGLIYLALLAGVTWMNTSLWGNRALAAEIWAKQQPYSTRATLNLAYYLDETQGFAAAQDYLYYAMNEKRDSPGLRLQRVVGACQLDPSKNHEELVHDAIHAIKTLPYEGWSTDLVEKLLDSVMKQNCSGVTLTEVARITTTFLNRPAYQCSAPAVHNLLSILSVIALKQGHPEKALDFLLQALQSSLSYTTANFYLSIAQDQHDAQAIQKLHDLIKNAAVPKGNNPKEWRHLISNIDIYLYTHGK